METVEGFRIDACPSQAVDDAADSINQGVDQAAETVSEGIDQAREYVEDPTKVRQISREECFALRHLSVLNTSEVHKAWVQNLFVVFLSSVPGSSSIQSSSLRSTARQDALPVWVKLSGAWAGCLRRN